jgi:hypothetical protein
VPGERGKESATVQSVVKLETRDRLAKLAEASKRTVSAYINLVLEEHVSGCPHPRKKGR